MRRRERDRERRADEDVELQARMAVQIARLFPRCPPERAEVIARHTALRGSGRVGRSAAPRSPRAGDHPGRGGLGPPSGHALRLPADVRRPPRLAGDRIRPDIDRTLASWA